MGIYNCRWCVKVTVVWHHCILPLILGSFGAAFFENELVHIGLLVFIIPLAIYSFLKGKKSHKVTTPLILGTLGITLLLSAVLAEVLLHIHMEKVELYLTVSGSFIIIAAHLLNIVTQASATLDGQLCIRM